MNIVSRTITGVIGLIIGLILFILGLFTIFVSWIYGLFIIFVSLFILFNKNEDEIERRKDEK